MNSLNQVILEGNVVKQPEMRICKNGRAMCTVSIAVNSTYKNKQGSYTEEVSFFDITVFGNRAELYAKWCPKGRRILVTGRLKQAVYLDKNGQKRSKVDIIADRIELRNLPKGASGTADQNGSWQGIRRASLSPLAKEQKVALMAQAMESAAGSSFSQAAEVAQVTQEEEFDAVDF